MKKLTVSILFLSVGLLSISACKKKSSTEKSSRKLDIVIEKISLKIPVILTTGNKDNIVSFNHRLNMDSLVKTVNTNYSISNLSSLTLRSCIISITDETAMNSLGNFSLLNTELISADNSRYPLAATVEIKDTIVYTATMQKKSTQELTTIIKGDTINYQLSGIVRKTLSTPLSANIQLTYDVTITE